MGLSSKKLVDQLITSLKKITLKINPVIPWKTHQQEEYTRNNPITVTNNSTSSGISGGTYSEQIEALRDWYTVNTGTSNSNMSPLIKHYEMYSELDWITSYNIASGMDKVIENKTSNPNNNIHTDNILQKLEEFCTRYSAAQKAYEYIMEVNEKESQKKKEQNLFKIEPMEGKISELPQNLEEALAFITTLSQANWDETSRELFKNIEEQRFVNISQDTLGKYLRNNWALWWEEGTDILRTHENYPEEMPELVEWFNSMGIWNADDMSTILIRCFWRQSHGKPLDLDILIPEYMKIRESLMK